MTHLNFISNYFVRLHSSLFIRSFCECVCKITCWGDPSKILSFSAKQRQLDDNYNKIPYSKSEIKLLFCSRATPPYTYIHISMGPMNTHSIVVARLPA